MLFPPITQLRLRATALVPLAILSVAQSQSVVPPPAGSPADDRQAPLELSPFQVSEDNDRGYQSTAMLQGGRGRIDLADVAGQVSVFTKEFLQDIAAVGLDDAFLFSATTATYFDQSDGDGDNRTGTRNPSGTSSADDGLNSRGLGGLDKTRNFFRTAIDPDSYNTERFSLINGANAVQFGLGGAAGTAESSTVRANLSRNRQRVQFRTDSYGSERSVLDISQVIIRDKLALRGAGLKENREYFLQPGYENNLRGFGTLTFQPFKGTTIRLEGEYAFRKENRPSTPMPRDRGVMAFLANPIVYHNLAAAAPTTNRPAAPTYPMPDGTTRAYGFNTRRTLFVWPQNAAPQSAGIQDARNTVFASGVGAGSSAQSQALQVEGYPWDTNVLGFGRYARRYSRNVTATIEQRLARATYLELGYAWEMFRNHGSQLMGSNPFDIMVDVNRHLPDGVTPNPMYGRTYADGNSGSGAGSWTDFHIKQYRATVTHDLDLTRSTGLARHLGRHRLALFASHDDSANFNLGNNRFMIIGEPSFLTPAARANPLSAERIFDMRFYLPPFGRTDDPHAYAIPDPSAYGDLMGIMTFSAPNGEKFQVTEFMNPAGFVGVTPTAAHLQRGSLAGSTSSSFFKNHLVVNAGVRHDRVRNSDFAAFVPIRSEVAPTAANPNGSGILAYDDFRESTPPDNWTPYRDATRFNYGFVVRPPRLGQRVTFGYDFSRNASLNEVAVVRDVNGDEVEPNYGESHEYSVRFRLFDERLNVKLNYFDALNRNVTLADGGLRNNLINFEQTLFANDPSYPINPVFHPAQRPTAAQFRLPGDRRSKGVEVDLTFNPSRNWRFFWNLGRIDTEIDDLSTEPWWDYLNAKLPVWQVYKGNWATATYTGNQTVASAYTNLIADPIDTINANLGNPGGNSQTWRSNFVATRSFTNGWLKGASASANFRYRGPSIVGFPNRVDARGRTRVDRDRPYKTDDYIVTGLMAAYRFKGWRDTSWRVQLNANNIFNTARVVLTRTWTNGQPRNFSRQPGREFVLSVDLEH